jgi:hypothetical protein
LPPVEKEEMPSVELKLPPGQRMLKVPATITGLAVPEPERMYRVLIAGTGASPEKIQTNAMQKSAEAASSLLAPLMGAPSAEPVAEAALPVPALKQDTHDMEVSDPVMLTTPEPLAEEPFQDLFGFEAEDEEENQPKGDEDEDFWAEPSLGEFQGQANAK